MTDKERALLDLLAETVAHDQIFSVRGDWNVGYRLYDLKNAVLHENLVQVHRPPAFQRITARVSLWIWPTKWALRVLGQV